MDKKDTPETIEVPMWVKRGEMLYRRDALGIDDPDQTFNYIRDKYDVDPRDYGIENPRDKEFENYSRNDLIDEILALRGALQWGG